MENIKVFKMSSPVLHVKIGFECKRPKCHFANKAAHDEGCSCKLTVGLDTDHALKKMKSMKEEGNTTIYIKILKRCMINFEPTKEMIEERDNMIYALWDVILEVAQDGTAVIVEDDKMSFDFNDYKPIVSGTKSAAKSQNDHS